MELEHLDKIQNMPFTGNKRKRDDFMRRYIIGTIFGFILATAASVNAEGVNRLIDQVVQGVFPVTVEGASIGEAVVIDNKTYLPVREFSEAVGYTVTFTESREVILTKNADASTPESPVTAIPTPLQVKDTSLIDAEIYQKNSVIKHTKMSIASVEGDIKESPSRKEEFQKKIDDYIKLIAELEAQIATLEAQK